MDHYTTTATTITSSSSSSQGFPVHSCLIALCYHMFDRLLYTWYDTLTGFVVALQKGHILGLCRHVVTRYGKSFTNET